MDWIKWTRARPELIAIWLFGSRARGRARADSDTDVAVLVHPDRWPGILAEQPRWRSRLTLELMKVLETDDLDLTVVNETSPLIVHRVLRDGQLLACSDHDLRVRFQVAIVDEFLDTLPLRELYLRYQRDRLRG